MSQSTMIDRNMDLALLISSRVAVHISALWKRLFNPTAVPGPAHRALMVPELLCLILESGLSGRDLFHCSLVCRIWGTWATDVMWRTCRVSLGTVLQVLDNSVTTTRPASKSAQAIPYVEIGNIQEKGWHRFVTLSNRISRIIIDCGIDQASFNRITLAGQTFEGQPFQNVKTLEMWHNDGRHEAVVLVTGPALTAASLACPRLQHDSIEWLCNTMPTIAPNINHLEILDMSSRMDVSRFTALQSIQIYQDFTPAFWESLSTLQDLNKIVLNHCSEIQGKNDWSSSWTSEYVEFPSLRTLKVRDGYLRVTYNLVMHSRMPLLESFHWGSWRWLPYEADAKTMVEHLKTWSPKVDVDELFVKDVDVEGDDLEWFADSDDERV
ncbi:hypothetical protein FRB90_010159 [Tulasnella sp. 427]|nr:hypothetical protein FRB90_010159 [Tulasnella sp. 427]